MLARVLLASTLLLAVFTFKVAAQPPSIVVTDAWTRATPESPETLVYAAITNTGPDDKLVSAEALDVAARAILHEGEVIPGTAEPGEHGHGPYYTMEDAPPFPVPAGGTLRLDPGRHLMLVGLSTPLQPGQTFDLVLHFERGERVITSVRVCAWTETCPPKGTE